MLVMRAGHLAVTFREDKRKEWLHAFFVSTTNIMRLINRLTNKWGAILLCMLCGAVAMCSSCSSDDELAPGGIDPDKNVPDPIGTITLSMRDYNNGDTYLDNIFYIKNENFKGDNSYFASVGSIKGLGNVANIPTTGWASQVAVIPGHGYVAYNKWGDKKFYRIYVTDYITSTGGGIIGAEVKYQAPFKGKDEAIALDVQSLTIPMEGVGRHLRSRTKVSYCSM